jgi:chromosome segregation ATPase
MNSNDSTTTRSGPFSHSRQRRGAAGSTAGSAAGIAAAAASAKNPPPTETRDIGIAAFAETIQERIRTLANENHLLQQAVEHLDDQRALLDEHRQQHSEIRRTYLQANRERLGVELEYLQVQDQQRQCRQSTAVLLAETYASQQETADQQEHWDATMQSIFCQHQCNLELYTKNVQGQIRVCELGAARRAQKIQMLREGADNFCVEQDWLLEQEKRARVEMERCHDTESEENDAVHELALAVRASTDKVRVLECSAWLSILASVSYSRVFAVAFTFISLLACDSVASCEMPCARLKKSTNRSMKTLCGPKKNIWLW